jgi:hypothetical protein
MFRYLKHSATVDINIFLRNLDKLIVVGDVPSIQFHMDPYMCIYTWFVVCLHVQTSFPTC